MTTAAEFYQNNLDAAVIARLSAHVNNMSAEIGAIAAHPDYRHMTLDSTSRVKTFSYTFSITGNTINLVIGRSTEYRTKDALRIKAARKEAAISMIRKGIETEMGHKMKLLWKTN